MAFITDLRTGSFTGGSCEQAILAAAAVQMGSFYDLPNSVGCGMTDAKLPDAQYGFEKALTYTLAAHAGANRLCEVGGMMGSLMGCSFESMVIDNDIIGAIARTLRGIEVSDETLSVETIHDCATGPGHYLGHGQTLKVMESEYVYPSLMDRGPTDQWEAEGSKDLFERSQDRAREILRAHVPNYLGREIDAAIRARFLILLELWDIRRPMCAPSSGPGLAIPAFEQQRFIVEFSDSMRATRLRHHFARPWVGPDEGAAA